MKTTRKPYLRYWAAAVALLLCLTARAWTVPVEALTYDVTYKWGLVQKKAGDVTVSTTAPGANGEFRALLTAKTAPWADNFYVLRDTLCGSINHTNYLSSYYERMAHEGGSYEHDRLTYRRTPDSTTANAEVWRRRKKETTTTHTTLTHTATGLTLDMLSAFYYMRQLDYPAMRKGQSVKLNIFSGKKIEILTIHYQGVEDVKYNGKTEKAYHITFTFTTQGGKVSSDNMDAWISTATRIPVLMEGKLPVGKVRAIYTGK